MLFWKTLAGKGERGSERRVLVGTPPENGDLRHEIPPEKTGSLKRGSRRGKGVERSSLEESPNGSQKILWKLRRIAPGGKIG